jgi:hypothetical protein
MKRIVLFLSFVLMLYGCRVAEIPAIPDNPVPQITSISPGAKVSHMPSFTLTITGDHFLNSSEIIFNGTAKPTEFVDRSQLTCRIEPADITVNSQSTGANRISSARSNENTVDLPVLVRTPSPGGGDSNTVNFQVRPNHTFDTPNKFFILDGSISLPQTIIDSEGNINMAWSSFYFPADSNRVSFGRSEDNGTTWSIRTIFSSIISYLHDCHMVLDSQGNIFMVGLLIDEETYYLEMFFSRSDTNGTTWSQEVKFSNIVDDCCDYSRNTQIETDHQDNLYILWYESNYNENENVYMIRSGDQGDTWSDKINLSDLLAMDTLPVMSSAPEGNLYVVWRRKAGDGHQLFFSKSADQGTSWSNPVLFSDGSEIIQGTNMFTDDDGYINVVWLQTDLITRCRAFYWRQSTDGGSSWSNRVTGANIHCDNAENTAAGLDSAGNINVVWTLEDSLNGTIDTYFSRSIDNGATWTQPVKVPTSDSEGDVYSKFAGIRLDKAGNIKLTWTTWEWSDTEFLHDALYFSSSIQ